MSPGPASVRSPGPASVRPSYGQATLADVMPSVLAALGVPGASDPLRLASGQLADIRSVAVLLVDGFGYQTLQYALPHMPTLSTLLFGPAPGVSSRPITGVFPSTTPASLASLGTGAAPGAHGLVGFFLNIPGTDRILSHLNWSKDPDPLRWQPLTTQFARAEEAGIAAYIVSQPEFAGTGLTVAAFRGGRYRAASGTQGIAAGIVAGLRSGRAVVYGYTPDVDRDGHLYGVDSPQWRESVAEVDHLITLILDNMPAGAALIVTADHGQINVPANHRFDLDADPRLRAGLRVVAGEARVRYLHTVNGATNDVIDTWRGILGKAAWVVPRELAVADGWFGPVPEEHLQRIGDVIVTCNEDYVILATATDPMNVATMIAFHGSATMQEMAIPLIVVRH